MFNLQADSKNRPPSRSAEKACGTMDKFARWTLIVTGNIEICINTSKYGQMTDAMQTTFSNPIYGTKLLCFDLTESCSFQRFQFLVGYHCMMTSSNGNIFRVTDPLCGEFTGHWWIPLTKTSDAGFGVFFDLRLNKRLNKQSLHRWFGTLIMTSL